MVGSGSYWKIPSEVVSKLNETWLAILSLLQHYQIMAAPLLHSDCGVGELDVHVAPFLECTRHLWITSLCHCCCCLVHSCHDASVSLQFFNFQVLAHWCFLLDCFWVSSYNFTIFFVCFLWGFCYSPDCFWAHDSPAQSPEYWDYNFNNLK